MADYPKYQVSKMEGAYQVVFRTEDRDEFDGFVKEIKTIHMNGEARRAETVKAFDKEMGAPSNVEICEKCGAQKIMGKNGRLYCKPCYIKWAEENKKNKTY